ncbi:helix-turn-helix domain-containing protein [Streptosporangium sp. NPDC020072]|uniref:AraC-like ligand-binding domain-containing protein n=1 Tax=Streptosporangium sp. NPDC020072 TaxID=3154788 RepID=UPI003430135D
MNEAVSRSEDLPASDRFGRWHETADRSLMPTVVHSDHEADFRATMRVLDLGSTQVYAVTCPSLRSRRTSAQVRGSDPETYCLSLSRRGTTQITQFGRQATAGPGDMVFYDNSHPCHGEIVADETGSFEGLVLQVPKAALSLPADALTSLASVSLPSRDGVGALLHRYLEELMRNASGYTMADASRLSAVTVALFTAMCAHHLEATEALPPETHRQVLKTRIHAFIQRSLSDPALCAETVAAAHQISVRHLYHLFEEQGLTVAAWIRRCRLERCRHDLADPAQRSLPIHAIAARWGFASNAHFSRTFRAAYGLSPAGYRSSREWVWHGRDRRGGGRPLPPPESVFSREAGREISVTGAAAVNDIPAISRQTNHKLFPSEGQGTQEAGPVGS